MEGGYLSTKINDIGGYMVPFDSGRYTFADQKKRPSYTPAGNDMVEHFFNHLANKNSTISSKESIDQIFDDRLDVIRSKIDLLLVELSERKKIHEDVLYQIDVDSCSAQNLILYKASVEHYYGVYKDRISIEKIKFDLEGQKRREQTSYFSDTAFLKRELREVLIQYQEEVQKTSLITAGENEP